MKINNWSVSVDWDNGKTSKLIGADFAPDIEKYLEQYMKEVETYMEEKQNA